MCKKFTQIDDSNSNYRTTSFKKTNKTPRKNKLPVIARSEIQS